jgi:hypothetical protein
MRVLYYTNNGRRSDGVLRHEEAATDMVKLVKDRISQVELLPLSLYSVQRVCSRQELDSFSASQCAKVWIGAEAGACRHVGTGENAKLCGPRLSTFLMYHRHITIVWHHL